MVQYESCRFTLLSRARRRPARGQRGAAPAPAARRRALLPWRCALREPSGRVRDGEEEVDKKIGYVRALFLHHLTFTCGTRCTPCKLWRRVRRFRTRLHRKHTLPPNTKQSAFRPLRECVLPQAHLQQCRPAVRARMSMRRTCRRNLRRGGVLAPSTLLPTAHPTCVCVYALSSQQ